MEHMKRMLVVVVAVVVAGAALMYVHRNMYKNCGDVKIQCTGTEDASGQCSGNQKIRQSTEIAD
jgi:hypothetical protein